MAALAGVLAASEDDGFCSLFEVEQLCPFCPCIIFMQNSIEIGHSKNKSVGDAANIQVRKSGSAA